MHSLNKTGRHCIALAHEAMSRIISTAQQSCRQIHCSKPLFLPLVQVSMSVTCLIV